MTSNCAFKETMMFFLKSISQIRENININTLQRYLYLYYVTGQFLQESFSDEITIYTDRNLGIKIENFSQTIDEFVAYDFLRKEGNYLVATENLKNKEFLRTGGLSSEKYKEIVSFVNLLTSYDDDTIFSLVFEEPSVKEAKNRNIEVSISESELSNLLDKFYDQLSDRDVEKYDVLSHWMNFIIQYINRNDQG